MATAAGWALQKGLYQALQADPALIALLGAPRIYDDAPQNAQFPYVTLSQTQIRDWSTGTETGAEHTVTLHVWSRSRGKKQAFEVLAAIQALLHDQTLPLENHRLVNMRHEFSQVRRDPDGETYHGIARFRAVTEPVI